MVRFPLISLLGAGAGALAGGAIGSSSGQACPQGYDYRPREAANDRGPPPSDYRSREAYNDQPPPPQDGYYDRRPVVVYEEAPPAVYYGPPPVYYGPSFGFWYGGRWGGGRHWGHRW